VIAFIAGLPAAIAVSGTRLVRELALDLRTEESSSADNRLPDGRALLSFGIANAVFTIVSSVALARASVSAFGAVQAFRSLVNWAPLIIQYLETHLAARMARDGRTAFTTARWTLAFMLAMLVGEATIMLAGRRILSVTVGPEYTAYTVLFAVMFALVILQSYTRTVGIEVRFANAVKVMWVQVVLLYLASVVVLTTHLLWAGVAVFNVTIAIMLGLALLQSLTMTLGLKTYRDRASRHG
jgi:hypothetical protein